MGTNVKPTILVVEDELTTRLILERSLKDYNLLVAESGEVAMILWEKHKMNIELVLLESALSEISTVEICKKIRADGMGKEVAIIILTAQDSLPDVKLEHEQVGSAFIKKPIKPAELLARVATLLEDKRGKDIEMHVQNLQIVRNLVARLNHELRNSMTVINGVVMTWTPHNDTEKEKLSMMKDALKHMTEVLDKVSAIEELKLTTYTKSSTMLDI